MDKALKKELEAVAEQMSGLAEDSTVPRNIRSVVSEAAHKILVEEPDKLVGLGTAIYALEDISNDINMPSHARTEIWSIISALEAAKEKLNKK